MIHLCETETGETYIILNAGVAACCTVFVKFVMLLLYDKGLIHLLKLIPVSADSEQ